MVDIAMLLYEKYSEKSRHSSGLVSRTYFCNCMSWSRLEEVSAKRKTSKSEDGTYGGRNKTKGDRSPGDYLPNDKVLLPTNFHRNRLGRRSGEQIWSSCKSVGFDVIMSGSLAAFRENP